MRVAGVDLLESSSGPQIMEVNPSPGLEGTEGATQLDVAGAVIDHISNQVALPYGKLDSMRSMVPERRSSQRKKVRALDLAGRPA